MKLTVKEMQYLYSKSEVENSWEKYSIKNKLRDVHNSLSILSDSEKIYEFIPELIPIIRVVTKIAFIIDSEMIKNEIGDEISDEF